VDGVGSPCFCRPMVSAYPAPGFGFDSSDHGHGNPSGSRSQFLSASPTFCAAGGGSTGEPSQVLPDRSTQGLIGSFNVSDVHLKELHGDRGMARCRCSSDRTGARAAGPGQFRGFYTKPVAWHLSGRNNLLLLNSTYILRRTLTHQQIPAHAPGARADLDSNTLLCPRGSHLSRSPQSGPAWYRRPPDVPHLNDVPMVKQMSYSFFATLLEPE